MKTSIAILFAVSMALTQQSDKVGVAQELAPGVYFHQGNLDKGHCNQGWVVFKNFVLVIDGNFPEGANEVIPKIRAMTDKPIRFAFDTHHHGDHMYGNKVWVDAGAVPVAHEGVVEEAKKYEPGRWDEASKERKDVRESELVLPVIRYPDRMVFDDGTMRVELLYFGVAHTHGDGWAWLPKERILFTGDACVNGPFNFVGDGDIREWIETLGKARKLPATKVGPGHGPLGEATVLADQQAYFQELHRLVSSAKSEVKTPAEMQARVAGIREQIVKNRSIARYVGEGFSAQVEKAWVELGGEAFSPSPLALHRENHEKHHVAQHGEGSHSQDRASTSKGFSR
jgi:glyoxylase-like metal-dependent hydrolase (beta-lactamase superfamily II)